MHTIAIRECQKVEGGFAATVCVNGRSRYDFTIRDPFDAKQEWDLEFYFEKWIQFPFDEPVRAQRAAASVEDYGEALFETVLGDRRAYSDYQRTCEEGLSELRIEIEGAPPAFQALRWEARSGFAEAAGSGVHVYAAAVSIGWVAGGNSGGAEGVARREESAGVF